MMKAKIESIRIEQVIDESPDTSYLGAYSNESKSQYAIDRQEEGVMGRDEYRFFNPNWENYKGEPEEKIREYCRADFERMESLNEGQWCYIGIIAKAVVISEQGISQTLRSGGHWGVESDSSKEYIKEIEKEQLAELRDELLSFGFGSRAIDYAMRNAEKI